MKTLILLRHAKSSWDDPGLDDHGRPLNKRGRRSAPAIAAWLAERGHRPDTVLCSSARRARETFERAERAAPGLLPEPEIEDGLYHAAPTALRGRLARLGADCGTALMIGHQPGLGALARLLTNGRAEPGCARAFEHFPTAAAAVIRLDIAEWPAIADGTGRLVEFAVPRELMQH